MSLLSDLGVIYHMAVSPIRGRTHAERLDSFYGGQAGAYDDFRKRLLKGRAALYRAMPVPQDGVWVEMGGGTGSNLEYLGDRIDRLRKVYVVDLSKSLLDVARQRIDEKGWKHVEAVEADATTWSPAEGHADVVTFSYSLTMIPDWFAAIDNARRILLPGGRIGVVDFYVSRKYPADGHVRHGWATRAFWPIWFSTDNVFPSADHVPYLHRRFVPTRFVERRAAVPYLPLGRVPIYNFIGRKPVNE